MLHVMKFTSNGWVSARSTAIRIAHFREADTVNMLHVACTWQSTGIG